jgi:hypothetical protein
VCHEINPPPKHIIYSWLSLSTLQSNKPKWQVQT